MIRDGIVNPQILSLLAKVRHTNTLVIADRGFPYWPELETADISLVADIPTVRQVLAALRENFVIGTAWMAKEFRNENSESVHNEYLQLMAPVEVKFEPHIEFKQRVPHAVGIIRTGDTTQYSNIILGSA